MNEVRLNIIDSEGAINGVAHCGLAEGAIAALSAEPETIAEFEGAIERFIKGRESQNGEFQSFRPGEDFTEWDKGTVIIDLAARIVATRSLYCTLQRRGDVECYEDKDPTGIWLPYCLPEDWLLMHSIQDGVEVRDALAEYVTNRESRRAERTANRPFDAREVLYGTPMIRFIADACIAVKDRRAAAGFREAGIEDRDVTRSLSPSAIRLMRLIHGRWLTTPRIDLGRRTPRDVILEKLDFIESDLLTREVQWSLLGEAAQPLPRDSYAYKFAGFGCHEFAVYYYLLRHLLRECLTRLVDDTGSSESPVNQSSPEESLVSWLESIKEAWLNEPNPIFDGRIPAALIEIERRRIPLAMSEEEALRGEDIPDELVDRIVTKINIAQSEIKEESTSYRSMGKMDGEDLGPDFKYFDIPENEDGFVFSTCRTREEWKAIEMKRRELDTRYDDIRGPDQEKTIEGEDESDKQIH